MQEHSLLNKIHFHLIEHCLEQGVERMTLTQEGIDRFGEDVGSWKLICEKVDEET